jgi:hypothetical protein
MRKCRTGVVQVNPSEPAQFYPRAEGNAIPKPRRSTSASGCDCLEEIQHLLNRDYVAVLGIHIV